MVEQQLRVFVSHSHDDTEFCHAIVQALRDAGADVWYDEHNLGSGQLMSVIQRELGSRPIYVLILSKSAFASKWVHRESTWAYELADRDPSRVILPVTAGKIERNDFDPQNEWLFLHDFKRIEQAGYTPYPIAEAANHLLHALALTPAGEDPTPVVPQPTESLDHLITRGRALNAQKKYAEALPLLERATQLAPGSFYAWANLGYTLSELKRNTEALPAHELALQLDEKQAWVWSNKGAVLTSLDRLQEALVALDRALDLDPSLAQAWNNKGNALYDLGRNEEALAAYNQALELDPTFAPAWNNRGNVLDDLKRSEEALSAYDMAMALDPNNAKAWRNKGSTLISLRRFQEALLSYDRAIAIDPDNVEAWQNKSVLELIRLHPMQALDSFRQRREAEKRIKERD